MLLRGSGNTVLSWLFAKTRLDKPGCLPLPSTSTFYFLSHSQTGLEGHLGLGVSRILVVQSILIFLIPKYLQLYVLCLVLTPDLAASAVHKTRTLCRIRWRTSRPEQSQKRPSQCPPSRTPACRWRSRTGRA